MASDIDTGGVTGVTFVEIKEALEGVADGPVDSGRGVGAADFWLTIGKVDYYVHVRAQQRRMLS